MGKIILCTSSEKNIGVSSCSLLLAKTIEDLTKKKILIIDLNLIDPEVYLIMTGERNSLHNIDIILNYAISEKELQAVIKGNVEKLNNSNIEILMGTTLREKYKNEQFITLLKEASNIYDLVIIDSIASNLPGAVIDYSNNILFFTNQDNKFLINAKKFDDLINLDKCEIVVNKYESNILSTNKISKLLGKDIKYKICYDKSIIKLINEGNLNINGLKATDDFKLIAKDLANRYNLLSKKRFLFNIRKEDTIAKFTK